MNPNVSFHCLLSDTPNSLESNSPGNSTNDESSDSGIEPLEKPTDLRLLLGLSNKKHQNPRKLPKQQPNHAELKRLLTKPTLPNAKSPIVNSCPDNAVGLLSVLANQIHKDGFNFAHQNGIFPPFPFHLLKSPLLSAASAVYNGSSPDLSGNKPNGKRKSSITKKRVSNQKLEVPQKPVSPIVIQPREMKQQHSSPDCKFLGNDDSDDPSEEGAVDLSRMDTSSMEDTSGMDGVDTSGTLHVCEYCNMGFINAQKLKSHLRCHIKPFPCTVCQKSFTNSGQLLHVVVLLVLKKRNLENCRISSDRNKL